MGRTNGNGSGNHSREQGLRLHHLANLGGLIALAGLDLEPPDYLLGALLSVAEETQRLTREQRERVAAMGRRILDERGSRGCGRASFSRSRSATRRSPRLSRRWAARSRRIRRGCRSR
jgi:hypothetical protein